MHQKTNANGSLPVFRSDAVLGIIKYIAALFVSGDTRSVSHSNFT
ncbi:hypothetical protein ACFLTH_12275 [Bacteroidota bacterium]